jgi:NAD(P)-dependent dehydrogenase (short-subunit alcohol dehydrogenase family)
MPGRGVLITGGGGGMGRAIASSFLDEGDAVVLADISGEALLGAVADLTVEGRTLEAVQVDVRRVEDCERMVAEAITALRRLDVLVNAAGVWTEGPTAEATEETWDRTIDVNLKGTFFASRYAIPHLLETEGCIVNISSDYGLVGGPGTAIYNASKGGVCLLTRSIALELAPRGVRCNAVCPADVDTPMLEGQARDFGAGDRDGYLSSLLANYPQKERSRFIRPEEVAALVRYLASREAAPMTGACVPLDFGVTAGY